MRSGGLEPLMLLGQQLMASLPGHHSENDQERSALPNVEERCPACDLEIKLEDALRAECQGGHTWRMFQPHSIHCTELICPQNAAPSLRSCCRRRCYARVSAAAARLSCLQTTVHHSPLWSADGSPKSFCEPSRDACSVATASLHSYEAIPRFATRFSEKRALETNHLRTGLSEHKGIAI
jgi:hypothetical protein